VGAGTCAVLGRQVWLKTDRMAPSGTTLRVKRKPSSVVHELSVAAASVPTTSKCRVTSDSFPTFT